MGFLKLVVNASWESVLNIHVTDDEWEEAWRNAETLSTCNKVKARRLKILHRAHICPSVRHKFKDDCSPLCPKCKAEEGDLIHCFGICRAIHKFWAAVGQEMNVLLTIETCFDPLHMLLRTHTVTLLQINVKRCFISALHFGQEQVFF